jgi:hypothetical protein
LKKRREGVFEGCFCILFSLSLPSFTFVASAIFLSHPHSLYLLAVLLHCSTNHYSSRLTNPIIPNTTTTTATTTTTTATTATTRTTTTRTKTRTKTLPVVSPPSYPGTGLDRSTHKSSRHRNQHQHQHQHSLQP